MPNTVQLEPKLTRFIVVSSNPHRASLGMMTMQLLGYHFIRALDGGLGNWIPPIEDNSHRAK